MAKMGIVEVTKYFPDGHTEKEKAQIRSSDAGMTAPWFAVDREWYFWVKGTKQGTEVLYKPSRVPYRKMTAMLTEEKWDA